jgi:hypothetical protein
MEDQSFYDNSLEGMPPSKCEGQPLELPSSFDPYLTDCDMYGRGYPAMDAKIQDNGCSLNFPSSYQEFRRPDCSSSNQVSYNRNILISSTNDYRFRGRGGEQNIYVFPKCGNALRKRPGARIVQLYTSWIRSSSIIITTRQEEAHGTCLAKAKVSARQNLFFTDNNRRNMRNPPLHTMNDYSQRIQIGRFIWLERTYHELQLNNTPGSHSSTISSGDGYQAAFYDISGVADDDWLIYYNAITIQTEVYATKAKGSIELSIQAPGACTALCWDPPSA